MIIRTITCAAIALCHYAALSAAEPPTYNRDIRPLLSNNCFRCHGPDEDNRKAKTRLDVPGGADLEEVLARISSTDPDELMPPPESNKSLSPGQIESVKDWIAAGAKYERHWAFVHPTRPAVPPAQNAIDFLHPASSAQVDPLTLARRVYLDLIGLPPTPEEADAFAADPSPEAYARLVDRLLASPRYGERWARRWLDLARYADTNGYEKDRDRSIWPYRDWVIRAVNADMPFDQFTIEQIAGDMIPEATPQQHIATGFHRNTMLNEEGGIDPLEFRFHAMTDRVATTGTTWLGLTTGCAQCHTHKFDPITHTDYFGMMAYLNNADEPDFIIRDKGAGAIDKTRRAQATKLITALPDQWPISTSLAGFKTVTPKEVRTSKGSEAVIDPADHSILIVGKNPKTDLYTITFDTQEKNLTALRLETLGFAMGKGPGRSAHGNFVLSEIQIKAAPLGGTEDARAVAISGATADVEQANFPIANAFDNDPKTGWAIHDKQKPLNQKRSATFEFAEPISGAGGTRFTITLDQNHGSQHTIGRVKIALGNSVPAQQPGSSPRELARTAFEKWLTQSRAYLEDWQALIPTSASANYPYLTHEGEGVIYAGGDTSKHDIYKIKFVPQDREISALRLEALPDDRLPDRGPGMTFYEGRKGDFYLTEFKVAGAKIASATENYAKNKFAKNPVSAKLATDGDIQTGWSISGRIGERHVAVFVLENPIPAGQAIDLEMHFGRHYASSLGKFRLTASTAPAPVASDLPLETSRLLARPALSADERATLFEHFLLQAPELAAHSKKIHDLRKAPGGTTTLVMSERPSAHPRATHRHHRGEFLSPKEPVQPRLPDALLPPGEEPPRDRLGFARWLVSADNPLTARVVANRQWAAFFGSGIVRTVDDFGMQGALPSDPALLDYLAVSLVDNGWSMKKLHREIVLSAHYRQKDFPRTRLEAEIIRDGALRSAGLLSDKMFGAPVRPPQPGGVTEVAFGNPKWKASSGPDRYRRSLYTYQKRTAPFAMFTTFDGGSGEACIARRDVSNTPLQALTLMNDPMFIEIAEAFGKSIAAHPGDQLTKIRQAFRRVLTRLPNEAELAQLERFHTEHQSWSALARVLLSLDEAITKP